MRFYKPGQTEYQSQFAPLDLNFIQKIGAAKDTQSYEVDDLLDKADQLKIDAGMFSKKEEVDKYNQWLKENVTSTRDKLLNQEITEEEAARNISKINSVLTNSEAVNFFNADKKLTAELRAGIVAGKYNKGISTNFNYLDPNNPQITPISYTEGLDALAKAGNIQVPGDFLKEHKDWYDNINTTQLGNIIASNKYKFISDPKLGLILADQNGIRVTRGQFKEALRPYAKSYAKENFQNTSIGSVDYMRRLGKTEEDYENRLLDSYSGYFSLDEDTRNTTYRPLGDGSDKTTKPTPGGAAYAAAATPTPRGIKNAKTFKSRMTSFLSSTPVVINPETGQTMSPEEIKQLKTYGIPVPQAENVNTTNMSSDDKKLMSHYFKLKANQTGNKYFEQLAGDIINGRNVDFLKSDSFYAKLKKSKFSKKEFMDDITNPEFLSRMELVDIRNNNVVEDLNYNAEEVYNETGIRNSANTPANLEDFLASALATQSKIYDVETGEIIQPGKIKEKFKDMDTATRASTRVGVTLYRPENNFAVSIGDGDNWANAYQVNIGGSPFVVQTGRHQDPVRKQREYDYEMINKIHTTLALGLPLEVLHWGKGDWIYDDSDKTKPPFYLETKSGTIKNSPAEVYQWGQENR